MSWRGRQLKRPRIRAGGFYFSRGFAARSRALRAQILRLRRSCARLLQNPYAMQAILNIDWVQFVLKNCEIPHSIRSLYDEKYKPLVYTPPDLLARVCKVHLSNAKKFGLICFPRICFRGIIYCDLECDRRCLLFFGSTYKAINFTLK